MAACLAGFRPSELKQAIEAALHWLSCTPYDDRVLYQLALLMKAPADPSRIRSQPRWLCVFELDDSAGPRRITSKPHLNVEQKAIKPGPELEAWLEKTKASKRPELVRVRYDLMPQDQQRGGRLKPYRFPRDKALIDDALKHLRERLRCQGFTVDGVTDMYSLYVIELDDTHIAKRPEDYRGYLYVGQSELCPEERARQHELGPKYPWKKKPTYSRKAHRYFRGRVLNLLPPKFRKKLLCRSAALRAERDLRLYFESKGYEVEGGTELLPKKQPSDSSA